MKYLMFAIVALVLSSCFPRSEGPTTPLQPSDRQELSRIHTAWIEEGLPEPVPECWDNAKVLWPASEDDIAFYCQGSADACLSSQRNGLAGRESLLVVAATQPRKSWRHEMVHLWAKCARLTWWRSHPPQFCRILQRDVENVPYNGVCAYMNKDEQ